MAFYVPVRCNKKVATGAKMGLIVMSRNLQLVVRMFFMWLTLILEYSLVRLNLAVRTAKVAKRG